MNESKQQYQKTSTGIEGLDAILRGGLPRNRFFLVEGDPGAGKTTLALQYLLEGAASGESGLYITLSETRAELEEVAASHGWDLSPISIFELSAIEQELGEEEQNTLFYPSEVELGRTTRVLLAEVERAKPVRVVFDSLSELRLLAQQPLRYRKQMLALKQHFAGRNATVLLLDDRTASGSDKEIQSLVHGVISLEQWAPAYGSERRRVSVMKMRGVGVRGGYHDYIIERGGIRVFPRLVAAHHHASFVRESISSDISGLDALLGGGIDRGTSTLILGPPGTGKSTIVLQLMYAAASRGERSLISTFDENIGTIIARTKSINIDIEPFVKSGVIEIRQIDSAELTPGQFVSEIREAVEQRNVKIVVMDSLNGYMNAMPEVVSMNLQLHELLTYLNQSGVCSILVLAQQGLIGSVASPVDLTYLADTVLTIRFFEAGGAIKQAISVIKKRSGNHERTIREFGIGSGGLTVGEPLHQFHGVLNGVPTFLGTNGGSKVADQDSEV